MKTLYCLLCGTESHVKDTIDAKNHCGKPMLGWIPGAVVEVVQFKGVPLPGTLKKFIKYYHYTETQKYTIYSSALDYLGDEHINPLNDAYKSKQIAHWSCEDFSAETYSA